MAHRGPRRAHLRSGIRTQDGGTRILNVDRGPGWVLLYSPNAMVRWLVQGAESDVTQDSFYETGPASAQAAWVGELGTIAVVQEVVEVLDAAFQANQVDGAVEAALASDQRPSAGVRYFASAIYRDEPSIITLGERVVRMYPQYAPIYLSAPMTLKGQIAAGITARIGWPPGDRGQLQVHSSAPIIASIISGDPGKVTVTRWTGPPTDAFSLDVSPHDFVAFNNPNPGAVDYTATWRNIGGIRQV